MPSRMLLSIGCDVYQHLNSLNGAVLDAEAIHLELSEGEHNLIKAEDACLLRSPTTAQLVDALGAIQDRYSELESLTIFFAGHGGESNGSYYLCLADTREDRLSTTGYPLSRLFEFLNELKAAHCNIIIDACNAGGMVADLHSLLKPAVIGRSNTFGVSIFISSAADQYATENAQGGYATNGILKVLRGEIDSGVRRDFLDLLDIGKPAARYVAEMTGNAQMPSVWGVNLYGHVPLFANPHASGDAASSLLELTGISPTSPAGQAISEGAGSLYSLVHSSEFGLTTEMIFETLPKFVDRLVDMPGASAVFVEGIWHSLEKQARNEKNTFGRLELSASCIALLLESSERDPISAAFLLRFGHELIDETERVLAVLAVSLRENRYALCRNGIPDLFYLPQRIARILGWAGAALHIARELERDESSVRRALTDICGSLVEDYAAACAGMSEAEAPFWAAFLTATNADEMGGIGEVVVSTLLNALIENGGSLAKPHLEAKEVYSYLVARMEKDKKAMQAYASSPSEILALVLLISPRYELQHTVDVSLEYLDHESLCIFVPENHLEFSKPCIRNGINNVFQIGHKIWTVGDLIERWSEACVPQIYSASSIERTETRIGAICASLLFPDRVPWFLLAYPISSTSGLGKGEVIETS
ncbi:caspase family protein [Pseudomonas viridiflava]|uniref:caspase family protein n=2 Tax=Pseudomonas viridiflava TaxID=33069 RepID=UPI000F016CFC|nr:caspase family protein [Pseudomonas viridiflava]